MNYYLIKRKQVINKFGEGLNALSSAQWHVELCGVVLVSLTVAATREDTHSSATDSLHEEIHKVHQINH